MCGIAGYFANGCKPGNGAAVAMTLLAIAMEDRGYQSWGSTDGEIVTRKVGAISKSFVIPARMPKAFALHTRYATTGKIKQDNSHPFTVTGKLGLVIGMHNGIIQNHGELNAKYQRTLRVDSQHIFSHIANGLSLSDLNGYGAIVYRLNSDWYIGTFNMGELAIASTREGIFFASTSKALDRALLTAGLSDNARDIVLPDNTIYKLTPNGLELHTKLSVGYTLARWDDGKKSARSRKSAIFGNAAHGAIDQRDYGYAETCDKCGDVLDGNCIGATCDVCLDSSIPDDWTVEVVPDGATMKCDDCGERIEAFQEVAVWGEAKVCGNCLMTYSFDVEGLEDEGTVQ